MSLTSKIVLGASFCTAAGIIYYVQAKQQDDIRRMHEGVINDRERQNRRRIENIYILEKQAELTRTLKNQKVDDEATFLKLLEGEKESSE